MKKQIPVFLAGVLVTTVIGALGITALAATGSFTITVDPVNIQVNGTTFVPKDAKGNDVPVFAYGGTTYAPLRALAEAYGLQVGYDSNTNMATVGKNNQTVPTNGNIVLSSQGTAEYFVLDGKKYKNGSYLDFEYVICGEGNDIYIPFTFNTYYSEPNTVGGPIYRFLQIATKSYHSVSKTSNPYLEGELNGQNRVDLKGVTIRPIVKWESVSTQLPTQFEIVNGDQVLSTEWLDSQTESQVNNSGVHFIKSGYTWYVNANNLLDFLDIDLSVSAISDDGVVFISFAK